MRRRAIVFSGQGAQTAGMGRDLAEAYPACRELFEQADEILGYGLSRVCFEGPDEELTRSNHCQPAIFLTSLACYRALCEQAGPQDPVGLAGLSLGEWTALHVAGALDFADTVRVLEARGRFMQEACERREGGMLSVIGLPAEKLRELCERSGLEIANLNSPQQTVLSGPRAAVAGAEAMASELGAKRAVVLNVAGAFHSSLMTAAAERLAEVLDGVEIREPAAPVLSNATGAPHGAPEEIRRAMVAQVTESVQWLSCIRWLQGRGAAAYIECGPGRVLTGLIKRIDGEADLYNVRDLASLTKTAETLRESAR